MDTTGGTVLPTPPLVVYIAGSGRSGSTLLERLLGTLPGFVNVGEINDVFRRVAAYDERCGCSQPFSSCPFWTAVGDRAFGGWSPELVQRAHALQRSVARQRYLPQLLSPRLRSPAFQADLSEFAQLHARLYEAVLQESDCRVVVDASKGAAQAMALAGSVDLRLVHLVRDARGVSFSWAKPGVPRPHGAGERATMHRYKPQDTAARWVLLQAQIALARGLTSRSVLVRYEDLVASPARTVLEAAAGLGLPVDPAHLVAIDGSTLELPTSHGLSGNPSRFKVGRQTLRLDEQWRRDMPVWSRLSVTVIAAAPLARYRYFSRPARPGIS